MRLQSIILPILILFVTSCVKQGRDARVLEATKYQDEVREPSELAQTYLRLKNQVPMKQRVDGFSRQEIDRLYGAIIRNTISDTRNPNARRYDPTGGIGYCYGRAMAAHLTAERWGTADGSRMSLRSDHIKKLFIIGDMRSNCEKPEWRFHVTTMIKDDQGRWITLDPIMTPFGRRAIPVDDWIRIVRKTWDSCNDRPMTKLYVTDSDAILPDITRMNTLGREPGNRIINIDLAFLPDAQNLERFSYSGTQVIHELTPAQSKRFFLSGDEQDHFDFEKIDILYNEGDEDQALYTYEYFNYFRHLLTFFDKADETQLAVPPRRWPDAWGPLVFGDEENPATDTEGLNLNARKKTLGSFVFPPR